MSDILNEFREVIATYTDSINSNPNDIEAYLGRGIAKSSIEDYQGAISDFSIAIDLNPNDSETYIKRGNAKHYLGDYYRAIADYSIAIELDPDNAEAYTYRANAKKDLGDEKGYLVDLAKAKELSPAVVLINSDGSEEKDERIKKFIDKGDEKAIAGDLYGAIAEYTTAIDNDEDSYGAYYGRAMAKLSLEDFKGAIADFENVVRILPDFFEAFTTCADFW